MIRFIGELDIAGGRSLVEHVDRVRRDTCLDLADVTFMDAAGVHSVLDACRRQAAAERCLTVVDQSPAVDRILHLLRLPSFS
jgi:anti-anti-sigma factor